MNLLTQVTIVIPTHYRHKYLNRILAYYQDSGMKLLVADSTDIEFKNKNDFLIDYFHYPDSKLIDKLVDIVNKVKTPYMLFCADDDFWVKESIIPCIDFLDNNLDYSSVQGKYILFKEKKDIEYIPSYLWAKSIDNSDIAERLKFGFSNYMPLFYALHRQEIVEKIFLDNYSTNINHAVLNELSVNFYSLVYGKHKVLNILTYVRDNMSVSSPVARDNLKKIAKKEELKEEYNQFKLNLITLIQGQESNLNAPKVVDEVLNIYINKIPSSSIFKNIVKKYFYFLAPLIQYIKRRKNYSEIIKTCSNLKGYPITDVNAISSWKSIQKILVTYKV